MAPQLKTCMFPLHKTPREVRQRVESPPAQVAPRPLPPFSPFLRVPLHFPVTLFPPRPFFVYRSLFFSTSPFTKYAYLYRRSRGLSSRRLSDRRPEVCPTVTGSKKKKCVWGGGGWGFGDSLSFARAQRCFDARAPSITRRDISTTKRLQSNGPINLIGARMCQSRGE